MVLSDILLGAEYRASIQDSQPPKASSAGLGLPISTQLSDILHTTWILNSKHICTEELLR